MAERPPAVFIVHDETLVGELLATSLATAGFRDIRIAKDLRAEAILEFADRCEPEVVLLSSYLSSMGASVSMIGSLTDRGSSVLVLTSDRDPMLLGRCLEAGAAGIFDTNQSFEQLVALILDAALGRTVLEPWAREEILVALRSREADERRRRAPFLSLSDVEAEVLKLLTEGMQADEIAASRVVSVATVRSQIRSILRKLGVNSQLAAVVLAESAGWPFETSWRHELAT